MIISQEQSQATVVGEIQNNRVGIDVNNINFITSLLTSNLYSLPIESFLRETIANAWDSQVEANNTNTPILVRITQIEDTNDITISIRDYGTGLSPQRFDKIYKNIGSSTKRDSNDYIGMLGIGRFACLSVSNTVSIKSYYNGKCYNYLMYKDGETLNIDLLNTIDTQYDNGVEVSVNIVDAFYEREHIIQGLALLCYFEQIYVDTDIDYLKDFIERFNNRKIHEFYSFKVCSLSEVSGIHCLMGNVLYSLNNVDILGTQPNIAITCDIGELDITPNRENLRYSNKTKECLQDKINLVRDEILSYLKKQLSKDYATVNSYVTDKSSPYISLQLWNFETNDITIDFNRQTLSYANIVDSCTIRGVAIPSNFLSWYNQIMNYIVPSYLCTYIYRNQMFYKPESMLLKRLLSYNLKYLDEPFKNTTKQYFKTQLSTYRTTLFIRKSQVIVEYKKLLRQLCKLSLKPETKVFTKDSLRLIFEDLKNIFQNIEEFNNKDVPKAWLLSLKEKKAKEQRSCILYMLDSGRGYIDDTNETKITTDSSNDLQYYLKAPYTVVYAEKGSELLRFVFRIFRKIGYGIANIKFIETAKANIKTLQTIKKFIPVEIFIQDNIILKRAFTGKYIKDNFCYEEPKFLLNSTFSQLYKKLAMYIRHQNSLRFTNDKDQSWFNSIYQLYLQEGWLDYCTINDVQNKNWIKLAQFLNKLRYYGSLSLQELIAINYFIYKHKIHFYEVNPVTAYKQLNELTND